MVLFISYLILLKAILAMGQEEVPSNCLLTLTTEFLKCQKNMTNANKLDGTPMTGEEYLRKCNAEKGAHICFTNLKIKYSSCPGSEDFLQIHEIKKTDAMDNCLNDSINYDCPIKIAEKLSSCKPNAVQQKALTNDEMSMMERCKSISSLLECQEDILIMDKHCKHLDSNSAIKKDLEDFVQSLESFKSRCKLELNKMNCYNELNKTKDVCGIIDPPAKPSGIESMKERCLTLSKFLLCKRKIMKSLQNCTYNGDNGAYSLIPVDVTNKLEQYDKFYNNCTKEVEIMECMSDSKKVMKNCEPIHYTQVINEIKNSASEEKCSNYTVLIECEEKAKALSNRCQFLSVEHLLGGKNATEAIILYKEICDNSGSGICMPNPLIFIFLFKLLDTFIQ